MFQRISSNVTKNSTLIVIDFDILVFTDIPDQDQQVKVQHQGQIKVQARDHVKVQDQDHVKVQDQNHVKVQDQD